MRYAAETAQRGLAERLPARRPRRSGRARRRPGSRSRPARRLTAWPPGLGARRRVARGRDRLGRAAVGLGGGLGLGGAPWRWLRRAFLAGVALPWRRARFAAAGGFAAAAGAHRVALGAAPLRAACAAGCVSTSGVGVLGRPCTHSCPCAGPFACKSVTEPAPDQRVESAGAIRKDTWTSQTLWGAARPSSRRLDSTPTPDRRTERTSMSVVELQELEEIKGLLAKGQARRRAHVRRDRRRGLRARPRRVRRRGAPRLPREVRDRAGRGDRPGHRRGQRGRARARQARRGARPRRRWTCART